MARPAIRNMSNINNHLTRYVQIPGYKFNNNNRDKGEVGEVARSWVIYHRFESHIFNKVYEFMGDQSTDFTGNNWNTNTSRDKKAGHYTLHNYQYFGYIILINVEANNWLKEPPVALKGYKKILET